MSARERAERRKIGAGVRLAIGLAFEHDGEIRAGERDAVRGGFIADRGRVVERLREQRLPKIFLPSACGARVAREFDADRPPP